jgi:hypothetical protein
MDVMGWEGCDGVWYGIDMIVVTRQGETGKRSGLFFVDDRSNLWLDDSMVASTRLRTRRDWDASQQ